MPHPPAARAESHAFLLALIGLTALRLGMAAAVPVSPDEAYYWVWSQAPAWSYYDHSFMVAVWARIGTRFFGPTPLGLRLLGPLSAFGASLLILDAARRLGAGRGYAAALLLNATLLLGAGAVLMTPDTPLLFFWTLTLWAMARLVAGGSGWWWLAAGAAAGLALDSKYTGALLLAGVGLWWLNPPVRADHEPPVAAGERVPRRRWLRPRFIAVLAVTMAATLVLAGTDVTLVAVLRANGELSWAGVVMALWAFYSLLGGFAYGTVRRRLPAVFLFAPMAVLTVLVSAGHHHWWLMALLLIPCGALCAPTITASADAVSRMIPASARGEAMGLHNSALTVGVALGGPLAGLAADTLSPPWGFAAVGGVGVLIALVVLPLERRRGPHPAGDTPIPPDAAPEEMPTPDRGAAPQTAPNDTVSVPPQRRDVPAQGTPHSLDPVRSA